MPGERFVAIPSSGCYGRIDRTRKETNLRAPGHATAAGTAEYQGRFAGKISTRHFRKLGDLLAGSIGIGTYLGSHDDETDRGYGRSVAESLKLGCNLIDTAVNYRCMRSERIIGWTLGRMIEAGKIAREEVIVCTKGGYIPFDGEAPGNIREFIRANYIDTGIVERDDLVGGIHAMTPRFLERQIDISLENLGLETIDLYYLHNPEVHRAVLPKPAFLDRVRRVFAFLEGEVERGRIRRYGVSSWEAFRAEPSSPVYVSLSDLVAAARDAGGEDHHFAAIQLPFNAAMMEGFALVTQEVGGANLSATDGAARLGLVVMVSAPFLQGRLLKQFPPFLADRMKGLHSNAERAIQLARSLPGVVSVLAGMSTPVHVAENLLVARRDPLTVDELYALFAEE